MINIENGARVQKTRGGKSKTYLNRENHCVFTLREICGLTWNEFAF